MDATGQPEDKGLAFAKDRFESCIKLADYFRQLWESRREYEWKISFGLWTLLGAGAVTLRGKGGINGYVTIPVAVFFYLCWLWPMWNRSEVEKNLGTHYRGQAEELLVNPNHVPKKFPEKFPVPPTRVKRVQELGRRIWKFIWDWSMFFQLATTVMFTFALCHFNHLPPEPQPTPPPVRVQVEREQNDNVSPSINRHEPDVLPQSQSQVPAKSTKTELDSVRKTP